MRVRKVDAPILRLPGAFIRRTNWNGADLSEANLTNADATGASFVGADMNGAHLAGTVLRGADLTGARNLTPEQLRVAIIDEATKLPDYIDRSALVLAPAQ